MRITTIRSRSCGPKPPMSSSQALLDSPSALRTPRPQQLFRESLGQETSLRPSKPEIVAIFVSYCPQNLLYEAAFFTVAGAGLVAIASSAVASVRICAYRDSIVRLLIAVG
jgi:hypothetical protein